MTKQIIRINASALRESSCMLRFYLTVIGGYSEKLNSTDIEYGTAVHKFIQSMALTKGDLTLSINVALKHFKNTPNYVRGKKLYLNEFHLTQTCIEYNDKIWGKKDNSFELLTNSEGIPLVEQKFSIPYYCDDEVEVLIEGTIDAKGKIQQGCYCIQDVKTTGAWDRKDYFEQYEFSTQLMLYRWAVEWFAKNGEAGNLYARMMEKGTIGCRIFGVFLNASKPTEFEASKVFFYSDEQMRDFEKDLRAAIFILVAYVKNKTFPTRQGLVNGACKSEWGLCKFAPACKMPSQDAFNGILSAHYKQQPYEPLREK